MGREAGLLGAGVNITVTEAHHDPTTGELTHLSATADLERSRKVKGHLHWVDASTAIAAVRLTPQPCSRTAAACMLVLGCSRIAAACPARACMHAHAGLIVAIGHG